MTDASKLIADLHAGLDGVTPGPWSTGTTEHWCREVRGCDGTGMLFCGHGSTEQARVLAAHIARCSPDNIRAVAHGYTEQAARIAALEAENKALKSVVETAEAFMRQFNPHDLAEGKARQWFALHDEITLSRMDLPGSHAALKETLGAP